MSVAPVVRRSLPALRTAPLRPAWTVLMPTQRSAPWLGATVIGLVAANLVLYVVTVVQEASLNRTQLEILEQRQSNVRLGAQLASAENPDRIETRATNDLHMVHAARSLFLPPLEGGPDTGDRVAAPVLGAPEAF